MTYTTYTAYTTYMAMLYLKNLPDDIHLEFKIYCVTKGSNMTAEIIRLMREAVSKEKEKKEKNK